MHATDSPTNVAKYRDAARQTYASDNVEIDDDAKVSWSEDGAWVQAWVWVTSESTAAVD